MACLWVAKLKLWNEGHHSHNYKYTIDEKLECLRESENQHSVHVISVYSKENNQKIKFIGHITDSLAKEDEGPMSE